MAKAMHGGGKPRPKKPDRKPADAANQLPLVPVSGFDADAFVAACGAARTQLAAFLAQTSVLAKECEAVEKNGALSALARSDAACKMSDAGREIAGQLDSLRTALSQLQGRLDEWHKAERNSRRSRFEEGARLRQWTIVGSWPEPVINGIVFIVIDESKERALINNRQLGGTLTAERLLAAR